MEKHKKSSKIKRILVNHINNNVKEYLILLLIFIIGIVAGVFFINNSTNEQKEEITTYINGFVTSLKDENKTIDKNALIKDSIIKNVVLAVVLWLIGSTVTLFPIIYGIVAFRGFCLGYTISSIIAILGTWNGILFGVCTLLLQNIIFIPALFAISLSGIKLYKSIMKDRRKENIKIEIYRHTIFSGILTIVLICSSFIEVYVSSNLLNLCVKYI